MGRFLAEQRLLPDLVVSSTALRAQTTADLVARVAQLTASQVSERELYLAPPGAYLESASRLPDAVARPLWVGHNPGLEDLVHVLTGRSEELPTAALVVISLELSRWSELGPDVRGTLVRVVRPRALDAG
jgi:phosphohistidine phosphatase